MKTNYHLTLDQAKNLLIRYQGFYKYHDQESAKAALHTLMHGIRAIQYDPLDVVGRNADLVLQARIPNYRRQDLKDALYKDQFLLDGWDKMMSIVLREDWAYLEPIRHAMVKSVESTLKYRKQSEALKLTDQVLDHIKTHGPTRTKDLHIGSVDKGAWGHGKLSSAALDYLFHRGDLCVHDKEEAIKVFDLSERLIPKAYYQQETPFKKDEDFYKWYLVRRLQSTGFMWDKSGGAWLGHGLSSASVRKPLLKVLHQEGKILSLSIEGFKEVFYGSLDLKPLLANLDEPLPQVMKFIAPLDNLLWDRTLIEKFFCLNYRWEVYTPAHKREYGYYVLPVLFGNELIARFEPDHHRGQDPLVIKSWWWQKGTDVTEDLLTARQKALSDFAAYLGADGYVIKAELTK